MSIKTISLFTGCGGLDLGVMGGFSVFSESIGLKSRKWTKVERTPFDIVLANDIMPQAKKVWERNFKGDYLLSPIEELIKKPKTFPKAELVIGGFPCQDFSLAGKRRGFASERGSLYKAMSEVVRIVRPKAFIAENVQGMLSMPGVLEKIIHEFAQHGYEVRAYPVNAQDYGVPQSRKRIFLIGLNKKALRRRIDREDLKPKPSHERSPVVLKRIFKDLKEPSVSEDYAQKLYSKAKWYGKKRQGNTEVNLNGVGPTIRAEHHGNIEFRRLSKANGGLYLDELESGMVERRLTIRECARIQSFPDEFKFLRDGAEELVGASSAYRLIGNAVPPLLAYRFAKSLADAWEYVYG